MAKKKTQSKKHKFKHVEAVPTTGRAEADVHQHATETMAAPSLQRSRVVAAGGVTVGRDFSYVASDLRHITVLAIGLVALELILWGLLGHTGLGDTVYRLIKV